MAENDVSELADFISTHEAAEILGISYNRMYQYVRAERLPKVRKGHMFFIPKSAVEHFKRNPPGRVRKQPPGWRIYNDRSKLLRTDILVQVRPNQQEKLVQKLKAIYKGKRHLFTGSMQRYVLRDLATPDHVEISLVWKDTEMPDKETRERELAAFREELADVLDWDTARYSEKEGIIYT